MARRFMIAFSLCFLSNLCLTSAITNARDAAALRSLYGSLGLPQQLTGWKLIGGDPCGRESWRGVTCSGKRVISINIKGLRVGGYLIGSRLSALTTLMELDLSHNRIGGVIPNALPPNATHIDLSSNNIIGKLHYSLLSLKHLYHMNVSHNNLIGPIDNVFSQMRNLEQLDLSFNNFIGDLPSSFTSLTNLHELYLQNNQFTGSVHYVARLPLAVLYIENNHFSGFIPKHIKAIPHLRIYGNHFSSDYTAPPPMIKGARLPPADWNINHRPKAIPHPPTPSSSRNISPGPGVSSTPSLEVQNHHHNKFGAQAKAIIIYIVAILTVIVVVVIMCHMRRSCC